MKSALRVWRWETAVDLNREVAMGIECESSSVCLVYGIAVARVRSANNSRISRWPIDRQYMTLDAVGLRTRNETADGRPVTLSYIFLWGPDPQEPTSRPLRMM